jgi:ABC-type transporter MlaC component
LFRALLERTYVQKLLLFEKPDFVYLGEEHINGGARVDTKIITPGDDFAMLYQLRPDGDRWLATKITIEDVSLTANLGSQLDHFLARESVQDLLNLMRRKYGRGGVAD